MDEQEPETNEEILAAGLHLDLGAALELYRGVVAPSTYGDEDAEYEALTTGWAVMHRTWVDGLEMRGEDRLRFLNSQTTCEVKNLTEGTGVFGFFTSGKGRVEADVNVLALADRLWLELPPGRGDSIRQRLEKYKVVDRVELSPLEETTLTLAGPSSTERLKALLDDLPSQELDHREVKIAGVKARLVRKANLGDIPTWSLWLPRKRLEKVLDALLDQNQGPTLIGWKVWDRLRIEAGHPVFGLDYDEDCFPHETGLEKQGVSYTKGCYLGQEVVARIHYRGGVQRHMRGLTLSDRTRAGNELHFEGKKVGVLGSLVRGQEGYLGLAVIHQKAEVGAHLEVVHPETGNVGVTATVHALV